METEHKYDLSGLRNFLDTSPSPFHAVNNAKQLLEQHGFTEISRTDDWKSRTDKHFSIRDGSLIAWFSSSNCPFENGFRIIGAHTDSPNIRLKPLQEHPSTTFEQLSVEIYGSPLINSWLDRDLGMSGRVVVQTESLEQKLFLTDDPICRIPQLAIHLDREINDKGLKLNPQSHLTPIWADASPSFLTFNEWLGEQLSVKSSEIMSWDLMLHDTQRSEFLGANKEWLASARIDNLISCYAAILALSAVEKETLDTTPLVCLFDHEEVGSVSTSGASGDFLAGTLKRLMSDTSEEGRAQAYENSLCLSVDGSHATHPNYPDRHDPNHVVRLNGGIVIKRNANQRYATDAVGEAIAKKICTKAGVSHQVFSNRNDLSCGSTIGPTTAANLGVRTIDVGVPQLSMHSAREICGVKDQNDLRLFCETFFRLDGITSE